MILKLLSHNKCEIKVIENVRNLQFDGEKMHITVEEDNRYVDYEFEYTDFGTLELRKPGIK